METVNPLVDKIHRIINKYEDPRTRTWPLLTSPFPTITIIFIYLYLIKVLLPSYMRNRKPYNLQKVLIGYNLFQVLFSTLMFYGFCSSGWLTDYSLKCQPIGDRSAKSYRMLYFSYLYYLSKFTELADTVLFVLRKKDNQVTPLHIFHHGVMPIGGWIFIKYAGDGNMTFIGFLNTFVHIVMYTYYMLSAFGPKVQKYLWWKKYITTLQLIQFVAIMTHSLHALISGCNYPKGISVYIICQTTPFLFLFGSFYKKSYTQKTRDKLSTSSMMNGSVTETTKIFSNETVVELDNNLNHGKINVLRNRALNGKCNGIDDILGNGTANKDMSKGIANEIYNGIVNGIANSISKKST